MRDNFGLTESGLASLCAAAGGKLYVVGGWVRDTLRGVNPRDKDYVACGLGAERLEAILAPYARRLQGVPAVVFRTELEGEERDVALAQGDGTIEDDLRRRELTVNAMAHDPATGEIIDPYAGAADVAAKLLRPVSEHFGDDPMRALRAARLSAQIGFSLTPEALVAMRGCRERLAGESQGRINYELYRALECDRPSVYFHALKEAGLLDMAYPEVGRLVGKEQPPEFHPEGDAFEHTMVVLDKVARAGLSEDALFAALAHDLGKGLTPPEMLPHHYGHEERGLEALNEWNARAGLPYGWRKAAEVVIREHMRAWRLGTPAKVVDLLMGIQGSGAITVGEFVAIVKADGNDGKGQLPPYLEHAEELCHRMTKDAEAWLRERRCELYKKWLARREERK